MSCDRSGQQQKYAAAFTGLRSIRSFYRVVTTTIGQDDRKGFRFSKGICLWVLQHVFSPEDTIGLIANAYNPGAKFYVLNQDGRCIPTNLGYVNDGKDVRAELVRQFRELERRRLPQEVTTPNIAQHTSLYILERLGN